MGNFDGRSERGGRSLPREIYDYATEIQPVTSRYSVSYSGYPQEKNQRGSTYYHAKPWTRRYPIPTQAPPPQVVTTSGAGAHFDIEEFEKNLTAKFERRLYETKMGAEHECQEKVNKVRDDAATDLYEYQKMTDKDIKDIKRRLEWILAQKATSDGYEYVYMKRRESWYTSEEFCIEWGGHLASIHDRRENSVVAGLIPESENAWISLNDVQKENIFVNTDLSKSDFRNWNRGQPDNEQHNENCVQVDSNGQWSDLLCLVTRPFVCKRKI